MLAGLVIGGPLLLGGAPQWAVGPLVCLAAATALVAAWAPAHAFGRVKLNRGAAVALGALCLAALWTWLQTVPMPWLRPSAIVRRIWALLEATPPAPSLSLDPGETIHRAVLATGLAVTAGATVVIQRRHGRRRILQLVGTSGALVAAIGAAHALSGAERLFGLYTPEHAHPLFLAPLLNGNHLAGFLATTMVVSLGLAETEGSRAARSLWRTLGSLQALVALAALSRTGTVAVLLGLLLLHGWALRPTDDQRPSSLWRRWLLQGALLLPLIWVFLGPLYARLRPEELGDTSKLTLFADAARVVGAHPWVGVGRGAFLVASAQVHDGRFATRSPESLPLQWAAEWGVPAAVLIALGLGWPLWRAARRTTSPLRRTAVAALLVALVHSLADFVLELAGVALALTPLYMAAITPSSRPRTPLVLPSRYARLGLAGLGVLALGSGLYLTFSWPVIDRGHLVDRLRTEMEQRRFAQFDRALRQAFRRHPADPALVVLAASAALAQGREEAGTWVKLSLKVARGWAQSWRLAALWHLRAGEAREALAALAEAAHRDPEIAADVFAGAFARSRLSDATLASFPRSLGASELPFLESAARRWKGRPTVGAALDARLLQLDPGHVPARVRTARRWRAAGAPEEALVLLRPCLERSNCPATVFVEAATALLQQGKAQDALLLLQRATTLHPVHKALWKLMARAAAAADDETALRQALTTFRGLSDTSPRSIAASYALEAQMLRNMGRPLSAARALLEGDQLHPRDRWLQEASRLAAAGGDPHLAAVIRSRLCQRSPATCANSGTERQERQRQPSHESQARSGRR